MVFVVSVLAAPPEPENSTGYIMISANGGLNQQRVAVCNAVAVARLLNATLVLPFFLFNSVWMDPRCWSFLVVLAAYVVLAVLAYAKQ
jgi:hypothetical protein